MSSIIRRHFLLIALAITLVGAVSGYLAVFIPYEQEQMIAHAIEKEYNCERGYKRCEWLSTHFRSI